MMHLSFRVSILYWL